jgi:ribosomal protein S18 acetylase RimI-like enzyme
MKYLERLSSAGGQIIIEDGVTDDAADLVRVHLSVLKEGRYFITRPEEFAASAERKATLINAFTRQPNCCFLVARLDGAIVGMVSLRGGLLRRMKHVAKLEIFVDAAFRGHGVGRALMDVVLEWATNSAELLKIGLSVFDDNTRAILLYQVLGFQEEGRRPAEYREEDGTLRGDVLMYRWVTPDGQRPG